MPKILHDPIMEAMEKKFPLKLRCAKCKRTLEFSVEELEVKKEYDLSGKDIWSPPNSIVNKKYHKLATCKCVCGHELSTADRDVIFVVENFVPQRFSEDEPLGAKMNRIFDEIRSMEVTPFTQIIDFLIDQGLTLGQFERRYEYLKEYVFNPYSFKTEEDANKVIDWLIDYMDHYGIVTVEDYYKFINMASIYEDTKYGWVGNFGDLFVEHHEGRYFITLPKVIQLPTVEKREENNDKD